MRKKYANMRKNPQICAKIRKSGFVHFLDSFVSGHSVLIPWVEDSTVNKLQSLVQAGQILQRESIRKLWLGNTFAMCMLQCVLFRLKLVLKLSASKCNCITANSVPVVSIDLPWRALSTTTKCLRRSITWGNNMQVRYDKIGLCSHAAFNFCWKHPVFPKTVQVGQIGKKFK